MPIPALDEDGFLPLGVHSCNESEITGAFGGPGSQRLVLTRDLGRYIKTLQKLDVVTGLLVDGSFVTNDACPNDVDVVVVLTANYNETAMSPAMYGALSRKMVRPRFHLDLVAVVPEDSFQYAEYVIFFQKVKHKPGRNKGILRVNV